MEAVQSWLDHFITGAGISADWLPYVKAFVYFLALLLIASAFLYITRRIIVKLLHSFFSRTAVKWDDILIEHKVFYNLAHIVPALLIKAAAPAVFTDFPQLLPFVIKLTDIYIVTAVVMVIMSFLRGGEVILTASPLFKDKPLASYFQLTRIIIYIAAAILFLSILLGRSPVYFLSAFGAMTAIILLIFKDTILGLVASV